MKFDISEHRADLLDGMKQALLALSVEPAVIRFQAMLQFVEKELSVIAAENGQGLPQGCDFDVSQSDGSFTLTLRSARGL